MAKAIFGLFCAEPNTPLGMLEISWDKGVAMGITQFVMPMELLSLRIKFVLSCFPLFQSWVMPPLFLLAIMGMNIYHYLHSISQPYTALIGTHLVLNAVKFALEEDIKRSLLVHSGKQLLQLVSEDYKIREIDY